MNLIWKSKERSFVNILYFKE